MLRLEWLYVVSSEQCNQKKNRQISIKVAQKWFHKKNYIFLHLYKNCLRMWEIWANELLPKALKSWQKSNKLPNLVTLVVSKWESIRNVGMPQTFSHLSQDFELIAFANWSALSYTLSCVDKIKSLFSC